MASNTKVVLENLADGYLAEGIQIRGGYFVADTLPTDANTNRGVVLGSLCYNKTDGKIYKCSAIASGVITWEELELGTTITIDSELSDVSENPVQNKVIKAALDEKADATDIPTKLSQLENDNCYARYDEPATLGEGYRRVAYIETHAQNVIVTEIVPNQNTGFEITYLSNTDVTTNEAPQLFNAGGRGNRNRYAVSMYKAGQSRGDIMVKTTNGVANINMGIKQVLKYMTDGSNHIVTYSDGSTATMEITAGDWTAKDSKGNDAPIVFFGMRDNPTAAFQRFFNGRLYRFRLFNLDELEYDFVPCVRESDGVAGLYEVINGVFYTDTRSGAENMLYGEATDLLTHVSQLVIDKNIITDNNFTNAYRDQIDANANDIIALQEAVAAISTFSYAVVQTLPTEDISTTTIYLLPKQTAGTDNIYDEYIYVNNDWELIGDTELDLSNYIQKSQTATGLLKDDGTVDTTTYQEELIGEQTTGQNIKTINGTSILGSGNIEIQSGGSEYDIDTLNSYLIVYDGDDSYFVPITKLTKPNTPTITTTTVNVITGDGSFNVTTDSGSTAYYKIADSVAELDGQTYSAVSNGRISFASGYTNNSDNTDVVKYVKLKAIKNGVESDESSAITLTIHPKVAKPSLVTNNTDKYISTATVVISKSASANATTEYSEDGGTTWTELTDSSITITVTENKSAGAYKVRATKTNYTNSDIAQSSAITLNKPYTYYGVTNATISASVVADLTKVAEEKSEWKVGNDYIKSLSYTAAAEHAVFAYPSEYGVLTHILDPNGYENISGWSMSTLTINGVGYNVYRTDDKLTCNNFVYRFQF